jgi:hypothetical protein
LWIFSLLCRLRISSWSSIIFTTTANSLKHSWLVCRRQVFIVYSSVLLLHLLLAQRITYIRNGSAWNILVNDIQRPFIFIILRC